MARSLNKCMIIGNLGRDPEMRYTPQGTAVSRSWNSRDGGEQQEETDWFRVTAWNKLAEICNQYLTKGQRVYVEGRVTMRMWDGNDGQKHGSLELNASDLMMLSAKGEMVGVGAGAGRDEAFGGGGSGGDMEPDDIPF